MQKTTKALMETKYNVNLEVPDIIMKEFWQATESLQQKYKFKTEIETLMLWILAGVTERFILQEFERVIEADKRKQKTEQK